MKHKRYRDKYGDVWLRISEDYVLRKRDSNIGQWFNGEGLVAA